MTQSQSINALGEDVDAAKENPCRGPVSVAVHEREQGTDKEVVTVSAVPNNDMKNEEGEGEEELMQSKTLSHLEDSKEADQEESCKDVPCGQTVKDENPMQKIEKDSKEVKTIEKTVFLIRHAESEENVQMAHLFNAGRSLKKLHVPLRQDVKQGMKFLGGCLAGHYDAPLSEKGRHQSQNMGEILKKDAFLGKHGIELIVHSPLQRARDTCQAMLGRSSQTSLSLEGKRPADEEDTNSIPVFQLDCLQEATPFEQVTGKATALGPRIREFETWIAKQKETKIAVVGHSQYFMLMLGMKEKFQNCDVWKADFQFVVHGDVSSDIQESTSSRFAEGQAIWRNSTMLHRYSDEQNSSREEIPEKAEEKENPTSFFPCQK